MPNKLAGETSPYLLQHKDNPVDWYPWGREALGKAKEEDKPILLSIGYSACHWCHVMAHELFENPAIAALMNDLFVNIKVDREERPDLDAVYMDAIQAMTGQGGWPMTVFLTPDGEPFYGGTYFPAQEGRGMTSFPRVLTSVSRAYRERRADVGQSARELSQFLSGGRELPPSRNEPSVAVLDEAVRNLLRDFDRVNGGTTGAPKFPQPMNIEFVLKQWKRTGDTELLALAELTLRKMALGGIYDQVGGGFHRYSVDDVWLVPHFEKMLYDNALLARVYLWAYQATGKPFYRQIAEEVLSYVAREMASPEGGFYSAQDADSEGVEGKFYVWTPDEIVAVLGGEEGKLFSRLYDAAGRGNFEGHNILHLDVPIEEFAQRNGIDPDDLNVRVQSWRKKLYEARAGRIHPGTDNKVLMGWNGLMMRAFAEAAALLDNEEYLRIATANADFVLKTMSYEAKGGERRFYRTYKDGRAHIDAFAEDYAAYASALISLYESDFNPVWLREARHMINLLTGHFWDGKSGGFFSTADYHEALVARPKDLYDNATPSANSEAAEALLRLYLLTANSEYEEYALGIIKPLLPALGRAPTAFGRMLSVLDFYLGGAAEVALVGHFGHDDMNAMLRAVRTPFAPNKVVAAYEPGAEDVAREVPLLEGRPAVKGKATAYICRNYICQAPSTDPEEVLAQLMGNDEDGIEV